MRERGGLKRFSKEGRGAPITSSRQVTLPFLATRKRTTALLPTDRGSSPKMNGNGKPHPPEPIIAGWPEGVYPSDKPAEASGPNYLPLNLWYRPEESVQCAPDLHLASTF